jgi:hypothetical protein
MSDEPKCRCGANCWAKDDPKRRDEPCWGEMGVSEDYPGVYTHFCEGHGHFEDNNPYKPEGRMKEYPIV